MSRNEMTIKLLELVKENPELPIIPATYYEVCAEDWGYWCGSITEIKVDYFYLNNARWYAGEQDIKDEILNDLDDYPDYKNIPQKEFLEKVEERFYYLISENKIKKAIILYIGLPE